MQFWHVHFAPAFLQTGRWILQVRFLANKDLRVMDEFRIAKPGTEKCYPATVSPPADCLPVSSQTMTNPAAELKWLDSNGQAAAQQFAAEVRASSSSGAAVIGQPPAFNPAVISPPLPTPAPVWPSPAPTPMVFVPPPPGAFANSKQYRPGASAMRCTLVQFKC